MKLFEGKIKGKFFVTLCINVFLIFASLLVSITAFTVSWFANNRDVGANNMQLEIDSMACVVISDSLSNLKTATIDNTNVTLSKPVAHTGSALQPSTHTGSADCNVASNLIYSTNPAQINGDTGLAEGDFATSTVALNTNSNFYIDYVVYVGSLNKSIVDGELSATFTNDLDKESFKGASSVDFYVNNKYKDTLNLAGYDYSINDYSTEKTNAVLGTHSIPKVADDMEAIVITMRAYFDGALLKQSGKAFITSKSINLSSAAQLGIKFTVNGGSEE